MSQAKVDRYKEDKKNRKQIMAREKRNWFLTKLVLILAAIAVVIWIIWAGYEAFTKKEDSAVSQVKESYVVNTSALDDYLNEISEM